MSQMLSTRVFSILENSLHLENLKPTGTYICLYETYYYISILAASPLASSGFAAIGCFRASPYGGILKNFRNLLQKNPRNFFFENPNFFWPKTFP